MGVSAGAGSGSGGEEGGGLTLSTVREYLTISGFEIETQTNLTLDDRSFLNRDAKF